MNVKMTCCKACGHEIAKNAKACPQCGAKNKKPVFKHWWFWVIIAVVLISAIGTSDNTDVESVDTNDTKIEATVPETEKEEVSVKETDANVEMEPEAEVETEPEEQLTLAQINALGSAKTYLAFSAFSYEGLIDQLEFEGFTREQTEYGAAANGY